MFKISLNEHELKLIMCRILCSVYTMTVLWASCCTVWTLVGNQTSATTAACHVSYIDNLAYILQHVWELGRSTQDQLEMPGHSQQWQRPGSLRFDSANSLWTWRVIWPLTSGSGVAGSRSRRPQPQPETDLWPAAIKRIRKTEGSHYAAIALPLVVWSAAALSTCRLTLGWMTAKLC